MISNFNWVPPQPITQEEFLVHQAKILKNEITALEMDDLQKSSGSDTLERGWRYACIAKRIKSLAEINDRLDFKI